jgi:hypothetical protein
MAKRESPRLKLDVVKTLPQAVINSKTPGADDMPGGFEGGDTVKVTVGGETEYHLFAHSYETLDWSHSRLDHWVSRDGLQWRHPGPLLRPYTDEKTGLWNMFCSPMPFFDTATDRWLLFYVWFAKETKAWNSGGTIWCAESKVKGRDGIGGPYDFPGRQVLFPGVSFPERTIIQSISTPFQAPDGPWVVFYGGDDGFAGAGTWGRWWVALASAPMPRGPYKQLGNRPEWLIRPTGFNENPMPSRAKASDGRDYWLATFNFLHDEIQSGANSKIGFTWSADGVCWPGENGQAVDARDGLAAGEEPWWNVIRTPHGLIAEGDGTYTCFFTATSVNDRGFRGVGRVEFKLAEET